MIENGKNFHKNAKMAENSFCRRKKKTESEKKLWRFAVYFPWILELSRLGWIRFHFVLSFSSLSKPASWFCFLFCYFAEPHRRQPIGKCFLISSTQKESLDHRRAKTNIRRKKPKITQKKEKVRVSRRQREMRAHSACSERINSFVSMKF